MPFVQPELPYRNDALKPYLSPRRSNIITTSIMRPM